MLRDRELFLGVTAQPKGFGNKQGMAKTNFRNMAPFTTQQQSGNHALMQAWNTTGFLPKSINPAGQKNSVKDFEYLKFLNDSILKDEVLTKFMEKAGEIEKAAGPKSKSPPKKTNTLTPLERIQSIQREFDSNPVKFHGCKNLEKLLYDTGAKKLRKNVKTQPSKSQNPVPKQKQLNEEVRTSDQEIQIKLKQVSNSSKEKPAMKTTTTKKAINQSQESYRKGPAVIKRCNRNEQVLKETSPNKDLYDSVSQKQNKVRKPNNIPVVRNNKNSPFFAKSITSNEQYLRNSLNQKLQIGASSLSKDNSGPDQKFAPHFSFSSDNQAPWVGQPLKQQQRKIGGQADPKRSSADAMVSPRNFISLQSRLTSKKGQQRQLSSELITYNEDTIVEGGGGDGFKVYSQQNSQCITPRELQISQQKQQRQNKSVNTSSGKPVSNSKMKSHLNNAVDELIKVGQKYKQKPSFVPVEKSLLDSQESNTAQTIDPSRFANRSTNNNVLFGIKEQQVSAQPFKNAIFNSRTGTLKGSQTIEVNLKSKTTLLRQQHKLKKEPIANSQSKIQTNLPKKVSVSFMKSKNSSQYRPGPDFQAQKNTTKTHLQHLNQQKPTKMNQTSSQALVTESTKENSRIATEKHLTQVPTMEPIELSDRSSSIEWEITARETEQNTEKKGNKEGNEQVNMLKTFDNEQKSKQLLYEKQLRDTASQDSLPSLKKNNQQELRKSVQANSPILIHGAPRVTHHRSISSMSRNQSIQGRKSVAQGSQCSRYEIEGIIQSDGRSSQKSSKGPLIKSRGQTPYENLRALNGNKIFKSIKKQSVRETNQSNRIEKICQYQPKSIFVNLSHYEKDESSDYQIQQNIHRSLNNKRWGAKTKQQALEPLVDMSMKYQIKNARIRSKDSVGRKGKEALVLPQTKKQLQDGKSKKTQIRHQSQTIDSSTFLNQHKKPDDQFVVPIDHVLSQMKNKIKREPTSPTGSSKYFNQNEDLTEIISTMGSQPPQEMFSQILRCYLSSQTQKTTNYDRNKSKTFGTQVISKFNEQPSNRTMQPESGTKAEAHFSQLQMKLFAMNANSKQSIFSQGPVIQNNLTKLQPHTRSSFHAVSTKRSSFMNVARVPAKSDKSNILVQQSSGRNTQFEKTQNVKTQKKQQNLPPKFEPFKRVHQQTKSQKSCSQLSKQTFSESSFDQICDPETQENHFAKHSFDDSMSRPTAEAMSCGQSGSEMQYSLHMMDEKRVHLIKELYGSHATQATAKSLASNPPRSKLGLGSRGTSQYQKSSLFSKATVLQEQSSVEQPSNRTRHNLFICDSKEPYSAKIQTADFSFRESTQPPQTCHLPNPKSQTSQNNHQNVEQVRQNREVSIRPFRHNRKKFSKPPLSPSKAPGIMSFQSPKPTTSPKTDGAGHTASAKIYTEDTARPIETCCEMSSDSNERRLIAVHGDVTNSQEYIIDKKQMLYNDSDSDEKSIQQLDSDEIEDVATSQSIVNEDLPEEVPEELDVEDEITNNEDQKFDASSIVVFDEHQMSDQPSKVMFKQDNEDNVQENSPEFTFQDEMEERRPQLQRPSFLKDAESMRRALLQQDQNFGGAKKDLKTTLEQIASNSIGRGADNTSPISVSTSGVIDLNTLRQRFNVNPPKIISSPIKSDYEMMRTQPEHQSAEISIEEQLQCSSIMAMFESTQSPVQINKERNI